MRSALGFAVLLLTLGSLGPAHAASGSDPRRVHQSLLRLSIRFDSTVPSGSLVVCKVALISGGSGAGPSPKAIVRLVPDPASGVCALEIPLRWTGNIAPSTVAIHYEIDAVVRAGALPVVLRSGIEAADPRSGEAAAPVAATSTATIP